MPPAVRYGTVTATFPDPPEGLQVRFRPDLRQPVARLTTTTPPLTFAIDEITATLNSSGQLLDPAGTAGVRLLADPDLEPSAWTWRVRIASPTTAPVEFSIAVTADTTVDLSTVVPVPPDLGAALTDWQQAIVAAQAARDAALTAAQGVAAGSAAAISAAIAALVGAAPDAMNTLQEIDAQLAADEGSAAALAALVATRAPLASPTFTGTVAGITAAMVGADASGAAAAAQAASLQKNSNLSDLSSASSARTALGLGTAATHPATDFDPAGSAAAVTLAALGGITPAAVAATYVSFGSTAPDHTVTPVWVDTSVTPQVVKGWNGTAWVAIGGSTSGAAVVDNGDGTFSVPATSIVDNGDGTFTFTTASGTLVYTKAQVDTLIAGAGSAGALLKSANLSDLASAAAARTNLGLGSAATHPAADFDAAGAASAAASAITLAGLGAGTAATHAATDFDTAGAAAAAQAASAPAPYITTTDPTVSSDSSAGFAPGREWINTSTKVLYVCLSAGVGAAVWMRDTTDVQTFTTSGTWTKPAWASTVRVTVVGPGGGGGSGALQASGAACSGGAGGGGGGISYREIPATICGTTETVTVGVGGAGGGGQSTSTTAGITGSGGTASSSFGNHVAGTPGAGGGGGALAAGSAIGAAGAGGTAGSTGAAGVNGAAGGNPATANGCPGGAAGGGISTTPAAFLGGAGRGTALGLVGGGGTAGAINGAGGAGTSATAGSPTAGSSGGGGGSSITAAGGVGGAGGLYGAGGGGGGSALNGATSGAGGKGGDGIVVVISR